MGLLKYVRKGGWLAQLQWVASRAQLV